MYYVYILKYGNNKYYKGITNNLDKRVRQHQNGLSMSTRKFLPVELVFSQICQTRQDARILEKYLKSGTGREIIDEIT